MKASKSLYVPICHDEGRVTTGNPIESACNDGWKSPSASSDISVCVDDNG